jgi:hypothetical protein
LDLHLAVFLNRIARIYEEFQSGEQSRPVIPCSMVYRSFGDSGLRSIAILAAHW